MQKLFHQSRSYYPLSNSQKNLKCLNNTEIERNAVNSASVTGTASPHRHFWCKGEKRRSHKKARAAGDAQGRWRRQQAGAVISLTSRWHPCPSCGSFQHGSKKKKRPRGGVSGVLGEQEGPASILWRYSWTLKAYARTVTIATRLFPAVTIFLLRSSTNGLKENSLAFKSQSLALRKILCTNRMRGFQV